MAWFCGRLCGKAASCASTASRSAKARLAGVVVDIGSAISAGNVPLQRSRNSPPNTVKSSVLVAPDSRPITPGVDSGSAAIVLMVTGATTSTGSTARASVPLKTTPWLLVTRSVAVMVSSVLAVGAV